jgi:hypothetical protein
MTSTSESQERQSSTASSGRSLLVVGIALALAASVALIFTTDAKWLRLGIISALWAALAGAFLVQKYRRMVTVRNDELGQMQEKYELELEREVAARREYELDLENQVRTQLAADHERQLGELKKEVTGLRSSLEMFLSGEVLVERVALRAESTRMRAFGPDSYSSQQFRLGDSQQQPRIVERPAENPTEAIDLKRVADLLKTPPPPNKPMPQQNLNARKPAALANGQPRTGMSRPVHPSMVNQAPAPGLSPASRVNQTPLTGPLPKVVDVPAAKATSQIDPAPTGRRRKPDMTGELAKILSGSDTVPNSSPTSRPTTNGHTNGHGISNTPPTPKLPEAASTGRRAKPEPVEPIDDGAHSNGKKSVKDLLAAYGGPDGTNGHHRRRKD